MAENKEQDDLLLMSTAAVWTDVVFYHSSTETANQSITAHKQSMTYQQSGLLERTTAMALSTVFLRSGSSLIIAHALARVVWWTKSPVWMDLE